MTPPNLAKDQGYRRWAASRVSLLALGMLFALATSCKQSPEGEAGSTDAGAAATGPELATLKLRDDTDKVLLTYIDEKGDFHVVQRIADVPAPHRARVRVVITDRSDGTGAQIYVADLTRKGSDGTYPVKTMTRQAWDELGAARRQARLEALLPRNQQEPDAGSDRKPSERKPGAGQKSGTVVAVIYGAEWCKPCHDAASYLRQKGVRVIEKDVEQSDAAQTELRNKLERAKMPPSASIPIIEIHGQLLVGFSPRALDRAVDVARSGQTL